MLKGFMNFIKRGNVVDLAVAVVLGVAFAAVVDGLVEGLINPLVAAIFGKPDLTGVGRFTLNDADFSLGVVLDAVLNFVIIAAAIYFVVVVPINALNARRKRGELDPEDQPAPTDEALLLAEIRDLLKARAS